MANIVIDGTAYEFSTDFDLGEARVIKRYTDLNLQQLDGHDPSDPDLIAACVHIALQRREPGASFGEIEARVNKVKLARIEYQEDEEISADPPAPAPSGDERTTGRSSSDSPEASPAT